MVKSLTNPYKALQSLSKPQKGRKDAQTELGTRPYWKMCVFVCFRGRLQGALGHSLPDFRLRFS